MNAAERVVDRFGRPVPATPVVRLRVDRAPGRVPLHVDGAPVELARGVDPHREGLAFAASRAARLGRPVRVELASPWSSWPLVVHPDGEVDDGRAPRDAPRPEQRGRRWTPRSPRRRAPVLGGVADRPRRRPLGVLAFVAALAATLMVGAVGTGVVTVAAPSEPTPAECRDVALFSVNGSGAGGGETLGALTDPLVQRVGPRLAVVAVPGPEVGAGEQQAVTALTEQVSAQLAGCPDSRVMLFGYSQGAQVAGDVAARIGSGRAPGVAADRILAVGLFGDPARDPDVRTVPAGVTGQGVLPAREGGFGALASRTIQVCAPDDPVCATPPGATPPPLEQAVASPAHTGYDQLEVAPDTPATRWASDSLGRLITSLPASGAASANPAGAPAPSGVPATSSGVPGGGATAAPSGSAAPGGSGYATAAPGGDAAGDSGYATAAPAGDGGTDGSAGSVPDGATTGPATTGTATSGTATSGTATSGTATPGTATSGAATPGTAPTGRTTGTATPGTATPGTAPTGTAPTGTARPGGVQDGSTAPDSGYETTEPAAPGGTGYETGAADPAGTTTGGDASTGGTTTRRTAPRTTAPETAAPDASERAGATRAPGSTTATGGYVPADLPGADLPADDTGDSGAGAPVTTTAPDQGGSTTVPPTGTDGSTGTDAGYGPRTTTAPGGTAGTGTGSGSSPPSTSAPGSRPSTDTSCTDSSSSSSSGSGSSSGSAPRSTTPPDLADFGSSSTPSSPTSPSGSGTSGRECADSTADTTDTTDTTTDTENGRDTEIDTEAEIDTDDTTTDTGAETGADTGALWALTSGLAGFQDSNGGNVEGGGLAPEEVESPNVPGRRAVKLEVPGGAKRSEVRPEEAQDIREGQRLFFGYSAFLPAHFPVDAAGWQVIWQLHDGGTDTSPPVALEIVDGRLWLANVGDRVRDLGPVRAGENLAVQMDIRFEIGGGSVSVYRDGQQILADFRPPRGTMIDSFDYLKTGIYRQPDGPAEPATIFLNDLKIGESLASVSDLAGAEQGATGGTETLEVTGGGGTDASNTGAGTGTSTRARQR